MKYEIPNIDFRLQRRQAFTWWYLWSLHFKDCDPALHMMNYLFDRFEHNIEQRYWMCWLYGVTYYLPTAWVIWNEFPDFELVGIERLRQWEIENKSRLRYQSDTKWNRGHLTSMFESYKSWVGNSSQRDRFNTVILESLGYREVSFNALWREINQKLYKFGRYSTWFYLQSLRDCCNLPIDAPSLMLHDYSGSKSHRNGLCYALGIDQWVDQKLHIDQITYLEKTASQLNSIVRDEFYRNDAEFFNMETALCSFKKLFRVKQGRYLGYYLDRQAEEIARVENDGWSGINWRPLWEFRSETLHKNLSSSKKIDNSKMAHFLETGKLLNLELLNEPC